MSMKSGQLSLDLDRQPSGKQVMVVGEHPAINPKAKKILNEALIAAGFDPHEDIRFADVLDKPPPEGKRVSKTMIKQGQPELLKRIHKKNPKYLLLMGNTPLQAILGQAGIRSMRGKPVEHEGRVLLPIYHPHQALADDKWIPLIEQDIRKLRECVDFGGIPEERALDYDIVDTWDKVKKMCADLEGTVSVDLETTRFYPFTTQLDTRVRRGEASKNDMEVWKATHNGKLPRVTAMQFGCRKRQWVVPMETAGIWKRSELERIVKKVTKRLRKCFTVYHNGKFDLLWMLVRFGVRWHIDFDTMLAHYMIDENDLHDLKYLAQKYLGAPDWDIEGKEKTEWSLKNAKYAAHDVFYTRALRFKLHEELKQDYEVNRVFRRIMMPCVKMFIGVEYKGVYVDESRMDDAETFLREELAKAEAALEKWAKKASQPDQNKKSPWFGRVNWGSPKQLSRLIFEDLKVPAKDEWKTKSGYSTAETVLNQIDHPMVGDLLKWRGHQKQLSSFIDGWRPYLDKHGFIHPVFKLHGTVTGRLSCEHPNLQQVPRDKRIRTLITAPEGWTLMEMDLSQIELRIAAELAGETNMLKAFASGVDTHWLTAIREIERGAGYKDEVIKTAKLGSGKKMKYHEAIEYILGMGPKACEGLMNLWKEVRKKAKAINFGYLYGMWWKKFKIYARDNYGVEVTDDEAQSSREAFFELYPEFIDWHDRQRRFAANNGYVRSLSGRKRRLPAASGGRDTPQRREAQRQAINSPVQSFANELNLMAALQMTKEFSAKWFQIVGTVHDAILMLVRNDMVEHVYNRGLEIMSHPALLDEFEIELKVPIEAEGGIGPWGAGVGIEEWLKTNPPSTWKRTKKTSRSQEQRKPSKSSKKKRRKSAA
jgi:uracil-DNA glycosylase family 4